MRICVKPLLMVASVSRTSSLRLLWSCGRVVLQNIYLLELAIRPIFVPPKGASCRLLRSNTISTRAVGEGMSHLFGVMQRGGFNDQDEFKKPIDSGYTFSERPRPLPVRTAR